MEKTRGQKIFKSIFVFASLLLAFFFALQQARSLKVNAAGDLTIGTHSVVGTKGAASGTVPNQTFTAMTGTYADYAEGRATGTAAEITAGTNAYAIVKIVVPNIDTRIDTVKLSESGKGEVTLAQAPVIPCYAPCALAIPSSPDSNILGHNFASDTRTLTVYYKLKTAGYGLKAFELDFVGNRNYVPATAHDPELWEPQVLTKEITNIVATKELRGASYFFEPDAGDYAKRVNDSTVYAIGTRNGDMTINAHTGKSDGSDSVLYSLEYSGGNNNGTTPTNSPLKIKFNAESTIALLSAVITRDYPGTGSTGDGDSSTLTITVGETSNRYIFETTTDFINKNGFYKVVLTDVFGYTHTLDFVIDCITQRTVTITLQYYIGSESATNEIIKAELEGNWFNQNILVKATVSSTESPFIAADIYGGSSGKFYYTVSGTDYQLNVATPNPTNVTHAVYQFSSGTFVAYMTVLKNETLTVNFIDRYGNTDADGETIAVKSIDKDAPIIYGDSGTGAAAISNTTLGNVTAVELTINASKLYTASNTTHNSNFANTFLLTASGFPYRTGTYKETYKISSADLAVTGALVGVATSAGFYSTTPTSNASITLTYYKADGTTKIGEDVQGMSAENAAVTKELFEGRRVVVVLTLKDYFPFQDTKLGNDPQTSGNTTYAKFIFTPYDDVDPILNMVSAPAGLHQQVQPVDDTNGIDGEIHPFNINTSILAHYVVSVWDNNNNSSAATVASFNAPTRSGTTWVFTHPTSTIVIEVDMSNVHNNIGTAGTYTITFTAYDRSAAGDAGSENSDSETGNYYLDRRQVLIYINTGGLQQKTYGNADPAFTAANNVFGDYAKDKGVSTVDGTTYYPALASYNLANRKLFRETSVLDTKNYQEVLPATYTYKLYQYWSTSGATFAAREAASIAQITTCNTLGSYVAGTCGDALVNDDNHEIKFYVGTTVYATLEAYYDTVNETTDGRSKSTVLGLKINTKSISVTPTATTGSPYTFTYGTPAVNFDYTTSGFAADTYTNNNGDSKATVFDGSLITADPYNVTENIGGASANKGYIQRGTLAVKVNSWGESAKNYELLETGFQTVDTYTLAYVAEGSVPLKLVQINPKTLTLSPMLGQYKEYDAVGSLIKVDGKGAVSLDGTFNKDAAGAVRFSSSDDTGEYHFDLTGWATGEAYVTRDKSATATNKNVYLTGDIAVDWNPSEKVVMLDATHYGGHLYTLDTSKGSTLKFEYTESANVYNNYVFTLDTAYQGTPTPDKKFVIVKIHIEITTNDFEWVYGDNFTGLKENESGAQGTPKNDLSKPAYRVKRTGSEVYDANVFYNRAAEPVALYTLNDLDAAITISVNKFGTTTLIPAGIYHINVEISDNTKQIVNDYDITLTNGGRLTVKSRDVYIGAVLGASISKVYGNDDPAFDWAVYAASTGTKSGLVNSDTRAQAFTASSAGILRQGGENVAKYKVNDTVNITAVAATHDTTIGTIKPSSLLVSGTYYNYAKVVEGNLTAYDVEFEIKPAALTATAVDLTKIYGDHDKKAHMLNSTPGTGNVLVNLDAFGTASGTVANCENNGECNYPYILSGLVEKDGTINVNYGTGKATIKDQTTATNSPTTIMSGKLARASGEDAGSKAIAGGDLAVNNSHLVAGGSAPNYTLTVTVTDKELEITTRAITVSAKNYVIGTTFATTYTERKVKAVEYYNDIANHALAYEVSNMPTDGVVSDCIHAKTVVITTGADEIPVAAATYSDSSCVGTNVLTGYLTRAANQAYDTAHEITQGSLALATPGPANNYTLTYVSGRFVITPIDITFAVQGITKVYGENDVQTDYKVTIKGPGEVLTSADRQAVFGSTTALKPNTEIAFKTADQLAQIKTLFGLVFKRANSGTNTDNVGSYTISMKGGRIGYKASVVTGESTTVQLSDTSGGVGEFKETNAKLNITAKPVHITAKPVDDTYDNTLPASPKYFISNAALTATREQLRDSADEASLSTYDYENGYVYSVTRINDTGGIISVTIDDGKGTAVGEDKVLNAAVIVRTTETGSSSSPLTDAQQRMGGTTKVVFNDTYLGNATNYSFTKHEATYVISPKAITLTMHAAYKVYGEVDPAFTYETNGCIAGNTYAEAEYGCEDGASGSHVGLAGAPVRLTADSAKKNANDDVTIVSHNGETYAITVKDNSVGGRNYSITYASTTNATLKTFPRPITLTLATTAGLFDKTYGDTTDNFEQDGYVAPSYSACTVNGTNTGANGKNCGLANSGTFTDTKANLNIGLFRYFNTTRIENEATDDVYQGAGSYDLKFYITSDNTNYLIYFGDIVNPLVATTNNYDSSQDYVINKRAVTITVSGDSATQTIEQRPDGGNTDAINTLKGYLNYTGNTGNFAFSANTGKRTADALIGKLCYTAKDVHSACVTPDFTKPGVYHIARVKEGTDFLRITNATYDGTASYIYKGSTWTNTYNTGDYEDANYTVTFSFPGGLTHGTLTINPDITKPEFYVGTSKITSGTMPYAIVLNVNDAINAESTFHTSTATSGTGYLNQALTKGKDSATPANAEQAYSYRLRSMFSLQAIDYYSGEATRQTLDANLYWKCEVSVDGETYISCDNATDFINKYVKQGVVGEYQVRFTVYDDTYDWPAGATTTSGNPDTISGKLYIVDTTDPTTGDIVAYSDAGTTTVSNGDWLNGDKSFSFVVNSGSDNSYGKNGDTTGVNATYSVSSTTMPAHARWWHAFSLDGGTTWYDFPVNASTGKVNLVEVLGSTEEGQVTISIKAYDNRKEPTNVYNGTSNIYSAPGTAYFADGTYTPTTGDVYGSVNEGTTKEFTVIIDRTAPTLNVGDNNKEELNPSNSVLIIEVGHVADAYVDKYEEPGFVPADSTTVTTSTTTSGGYTRAISSPTSYNRLKTTTMKIGYVTGTGLGATDYSIKASFASYFDEGSRLTIFTPDAAKRTEIASKIDYADQGGGVYKEGLYVVSYTAEDQAGNITAWTRRIVIKDLRPLWVKVPTTNTTVSNQMKGDGSYEVVAGMSFVEPEVYTVNYDGVQMLNVAITKTIFFEGREVDKIDTNVVGEYTIRYDAVGGDYGLAAQTLNISVRVIPDTDMSVVDSVESNSVTSIALIVGLCLLLAGLSLGYVVMKKKD